MRKMILVPEIVCICLMSKKLKVRGDHRLSSRNDIY